MSDAAIAKIDPSAISRPDRSLLHYYLIISILTGPGFPFLVLPLVFKYMTLKYAFDESGVSMSWGVLFRREVHLTYRRIQDIHLTRNLIQRWMGLATVGIQTASASSGPEMSIEGILEAEQLRDYLYVQMRGARGLDAPGPDGTGDSSDGGGSSNDEVLTLLVEIRDGVRRLVEAQGRPSDPAGGAAGS